tara:strand:+ start:320 stop:508 length:189 start_codon:yes stop_codon:yes gene_type:complete
MKKFNAYLEEKPILSASKLIPASAKTLRKLANGVLDDKVAEMSPKERQNLAHHLQGLVDALK